MFTACICSYTHSDSLQSEETSKIDLLLLYMPALWGSLIIITWPVVRSYHYSALEIRQLFCCSCGWAEKIIPSDYLGFLCLLLMLFNMGIIWKQLDLLYVITLLGLHEHEISLLHSIPALTLLFSYYWSVMCAINNIRARTVQKKKKCYMSKQLFLQLMQHMVRQLWRIDGDASFL